MGGTIVGTAQANENRRAGILVARNLLRWREIYLAIEESQPHAFLFDLVASHMLGGPLQESPEELDMLCDSAVAASSHPLARYAFRVLHGVVGCPVRLRLARSGVRLNHDYLPGYEGRALERDNMLIIDVQEADQRLVAHGRLALDTPLWHGVQLEVITWFGTVRARHDRHDMEFRPIRGAALSDLSPCVSPRWSKAVGPTQMLLHYRCGHEWRIRPDGGLNVRVDCKVRHNLSMLGMHRFRRALPQRDRTHYLSRYCRSVRSELAGLYSHHDGALLFRPIGFRSETAHIEILGLADQDMVLENLQQDLRSACWRRNLLNELLNQFDCSDKSDLCVLARAGASTFILIGAGRCAGQVVRLTVANGRSFQWSLSPLEAVEKIVARVCDLCRRRPLIAFLDPNQPEQARELTLRRVEWP